MSEDIYDQSIDNFDMWFNRIEQFGLLEQYQKIVTSNKITTTESLIVLMKTLVENMTIPKELEILNLNTVLNDGVPQIEWRVDKLIPKRGITFFGGTAGCYKTWTAMDLSVCCATGKPFLNYFDVEKCNVLYIDEENGNITLPNRFDILRRAHCLENDDLSDIKLSIFNNIKLDTPDGGEILSSIIKKYDIKLVIIDSMVRCMEGEEDKAVNVKNVFNNLKNIFVQYQDLSFVLLHHTKKGASGMDALRGSGDFAASADCVLMFKSKHNGYINVEIAKNRHIDMSEFNKFSISVQDAGDRGLIFAYCDGDGFKSSKEVVQEIILDWANGVETGQPLINFKGAQAIDEVRKYGYGKTMGYEYLKALVDSNHLIKEKNGYYSVRKNKEIDEDYY